MGKLIVITPTYNHAGLLCELYNSLCRQTNKNFIWLIVNDGSKDNTEGKVKQFISEGIINILYVEKLNGGKSSALNIAFDRVEKEDFVLIVDDDEVLHSDAIEIVNRYKNELTKDSNIGIFLFNRINKRTKQVIANPILEKDLYLDFYEWKRKYSFDGYIAYTGYALEGIRFPILDNEKYIGPSVLMMLVSRKYKLLYSKEIIGETEYQEEGITKQGRVLRLKNPVGNIYYCFLLQDKRAGLLLHLKYSILGYGYYFYRSLKESELLNVGISINKFNNLMKFPGFLLSEYWKQKYGESSRGGRINS